MFVVPTYLKKSPVHGLGVYAGCDIRKGDLVWRFDPAVDVCLPLEDVEHMSGMMAEFIDNYLYRDKNVFVGGYIYNSDHAKFTNHGENPNISARGKHHVALRDITANEELICDYREFDWKSEESMPDFIKAAAR